MAKRGSPLISVPSEQTPQLVYASDEDPGITRVVWGRGFSFRDPEGQKISDQHIIARCKALAIPPSYRDVWICPLENGHLQAVGRDEKDRKQYLYHPLWTEQQKEKKFEKLLELGRGLPRFRREVRAALALEIPHKKAAVASAARLIDKLGYRVGSEAYLKDNQTRGITTLAKHNVALEEDSSLIHLSYRGKGGAEIEATLSDPTLQVRIEQCHELPGQRLFQYRGESGEPQIVQSSDVNDFLGECFAAKVTTKDLRTWRASALQVEHLRKHSEIDDPESVYQAALQQTANQLNHTPTICEEHYVHPKIKAQFWQHRRAGFSALLPPENSELQLSERLLLHLLSL